MTSMLIIIHIIVCIALIMTVLLQAGKGADMGAAFGGGSSQTLLGSSGASTLLGKATTIVAIVFMLTSLSLAYISSKGGTRDSIMKSAPAAQTQPQAAQEKTHVEKLIEEASQAGEASTGADKTAAGKSETTQP